LVKGIVILSEAKNLWFDGRGSNCIAMQDVSPAQPDSDRIAALTLQRLNASTGM
jgi:hypothetical protein